MDRTISLTVNGKAVSANVDPRTLLVQLLRENLGLTGTHVGCDTAQCGACTVHLNGRAVKSCSMLAVQAQGGKVTTIEGSGGRDGELHPMQAAFRECHGLQCGFCTPGMVMSSIQLLKRQPEGDRGRDPRGARGQHLPLHRLSQHRQAIQFCQSGKPVAAWEPDHDQRSCRHSTRSGKSIAAARISASSPAPASTPTTWCCRARHTACSCARRTRMRASGHRPRRGGGAPGVVAIFTGADLAEAKVGGLPCGWLIHSKDGTPMKEPPHPVLAQGKVRHVGDEVALVVAET